MYDYHEQKVSRILDSKVKKPQQPAISEILQFQRTAQFVKTEEFNVQDQNSINSQAFKDFLLLKGYATKGTFDTKVGYTQWLLKRDKPKVELYLQEYRLEASPIPVPLIPVSVPTQIVPSIIEPEEEEAEEVLPQMVMPAPIPAIAPATSVPSIDKWDTDRSFHTETRRRLEPFNTRWNGPSDKASIVSLPAAIAHLNTEGRYFSHEMMPQYLDFAIAQGGLQSGYRTTRALGLQGAKRDQGKVQHDFVFTRQLPSKPMKMTLADGQVGAGVGAMVVLSPTMFEDPDQITFFKTMDGAHHNPLIIPPKLRKGDHIKSLSDAIAASADKVFHGSQEQGVQKNIALRHIAGIVLKAKTGADLAGKKREFIEHLQQTPASSMLPPKTVRDRIKSLPPWQQQGEYNRWKLEEGNKSLYQVLEEGLNSGLAEGEEGRTVESIIHALEAAKTKRSEVVKNIGLQ